MRQLHCIVIMALSCVFCFAAFADTECPAGYQPEEYVELEYIESTGTQYIDTGIAPGLTTCFDAEFSFNVLTVTQTVIGSEYNSAGSKYYADRVLYSNNKIIYQSDSARTISDIATPVVNKKYYVERGLNTFRVNDNIYDINVIEAGIKNITLFASPMRLNNTHEYYAFIKMYGARIYNGIDNVNIREFVPTKRLSDGAIGMYDRVSGEFFGNSGTGEFRAGPEVQSFITDENSNVACISCPTNTYKPNAGNEACTPCLEHTFSPIGSTSCAKILRVNGYIVYMPVGKRTEHGLCTMFDGKKYCADMYER